MNRRLLTLPVYVFLIGFVLASIFIPRFLQTSETSAHQELNAVWQRVRQSGAYRFSAQMEQVLAPQPTLINAGRSSQHTSVYMEGQANLDAASMLLTLWSNGGSPSVPESGVQVRVKGDKTYVRKGNEAWQEAGDVTSALAPGGEIMAYVQAAENVVRHERARLSTVAGDILVTRYTFDVNGRRFAEYMHGQMQQQALREGLPSDIRLELPRAYVEMAGTGELWVGENGLPLRQEVELRFPERADNYLPTAHATVDFFDFDPLPPTAFSSRVIHQLEGVVHTIASPNLLTSMLATLLAVILSAALILYRYSKRVYAIVVISILVSMTLMPLLRTNRLHAFSIQQQERQGEELAQSKKSESQAEFQTQLFKTSFDANADPLKIAMAQTQEPAVAAAAQEDGEYFDPLCESDPSGDDDGDQLTNLQECLIGTLPTVADTDGDNVNDNVEVQGVLLPGTNGNDMWYLDPLNMDSNNDGIADGNEWHLDANHDGKPDDTDGDLEPDMWDLDNDGDGVPDNLDLSPYTSTKDDTAFSGNNPFQLTLDNLVSDNLVKVDFQLSPTDANHLWYTQNVLDWPDNDLQGPIQDSDGATFFSVDNSITANPNDNGDMRLVPMLEIDITGTITNLPSADILNQFGISVQETTADTLTAYAPVQLVTDSNGDKNVAFFGSMYYQADGSWGNAHSVRLVWLVQALVDKCGNYTDNLCDTYTTLNQSEVIQTYDDEWFLTGLHVTEERGATMDIIYEDPAVTPTIEAGYDAPLYMDTLFALVYDLDHTFLAGADCETLDQAGECVGDGQLDITTAEIARRFDHDTNGGVSDTERWNLYNVLDVEMRSYQSIDLAMMDTNITQTMRILTDTFTSAWSASAPITPTILYAYDQTYRSLNLDETLSGNVNVNLSGSAMTMDFPTTGNNSVDIQTMASLRWLPYSYDPLMGWTIADIETYYDELDTQLQSSLTDITDPDEKLAYQTMGQVFYLSIYSGDGNVVRQGDVTLTQEYQQTDATLAVSLITGTGTLIKSVIRSYYFYAPEIQNIALEYRAITGEQASGSYVASTFLEQQTYQYLYTTKGRVQLGIVAIIVVFAAVSLFAKYALGETGTGWSITAAASVGALTIIFSIYKPIMRVVDAVRALTSGSTAVTTGQATLQVLTSSSEVIKSSRVAGFVGLVISIGIAIGIFLYVVGSGKVDAGTIAFNFLIATTIATIIVVVLFYILSLSVIGSLLVAIISVIDIILLLLGIGWSITGWLTSVIAGVIYHVDLLEDVDVDVGELDMTLTHPNEGLSAGNRMHYSIPITTALTSRRSNLGINSLIYELDEQAAQLSTRLDDRESEWVLGISKIITETYSPGVIVTDTVYSATIIETPSFTSTLSAGVDTETPLVLNTAYALRAQSCWVGFCKGITVSGSSSDNLGEAIVLDVLPATLDEFLDVITWSDGKVRFLDMDGDGLLPFDEGGVDPDDTTWDADGDNLSDAYELTLRAKTYAEGGLDLDPLLKDTDGDGVRDDEEIRHGTNPGNSDSDGDGLRDSEEIAPAGGWLLPYSPTATTKVWSDPLQRDADGDGLSDLFERTQDTCPTCTPWADLNAPQVYSPNSWNANPVSLYIDDGVRDNIVAPGATFFYTTTTANNLGTDQTLEGELFLNLPTGFSGQPLSAGVAISSGNLETLVSQVTVNATQSGPYVLTSAMNLTDFEITAWSWDSPQTTSGNTSSGNGSDPAIAVATGWSDPYVVVMLETATDGSQQIVGYTAAADGTLSNATPLSSVTTNSTLTAPDISCDENGICLVVWGENFASGLGVISGVRLQDGFANENSLLIWQTSEVNVPSEENGTPTDTITVQSPHVASDGTDFMLGWASAANSQTQLWVRPVGSAGGFAADAQSLSGPAADMVGVALGYDSVDYVSVWRNGTTLYRAEIDHAGQISGEQVVVEGAGWVDANGNESPPLLTFDQISKQALLLYRAVVNGNNELHALRLNALTATTPLSLTTDSLLNTNGVDTALCADPKNGGWVTAWSLPGQNDIFYQAVSPDGSLRGFTESVTSANSAGIALACSIPRATLALEFEEEPGATTFADSSGFGNDITCQTANCPLSGVDGRFGSGVEFDGVDDYLATNFTQSLQASTTDLWFHTLEHNAMIMHRQNSVKQIYLQDGNVCANLRVVSGNSTAQDVLCTSGVAYDDGTWHHAVHVTDNGVHSLYVDGALIGQSQQKTADTACDPYCTGFTLVQDGTSYYQITLDAVRYYNRALTGAEIADSFDAAEAIYDLDEVAGSTTFIDATSNGFNATCSGNSCPTMGVAGISYSAAQFDGSDDALQVLPTKRQVDRFTYDFESGVDPAWDQTVTGSATRDGSSTTYLGNFDNDTVNLTLDNLPVHDTITVTFDLYVLGGWAGLVTTSDGPDEWEWGYGNTKVLRTSFANQDSAGHYQAYPLDSSSSAINSSFYPVRLYGDKNCQNRKTLIEQDTPDLSTTDVGNNNVSCIQYAFNTVALFYQHINYGGKVWTLDPDRSIYPNNFSNNEIGSVRTWPAPNDPKTGALGDVLTTNSFNNNAVYRIVHTISNHTADSLQLYFTGLTATNNQNVWALDNVDVTVWNEGGSLPLTNSSFTLSSWAKRSASGRAELLLSQGAATKNEGLQFGFRADNTFLCAFWNNGLPTSATYTDTEWHHWACTYDATTKQRTIYRDGVQVAQDTASAHYSGSGTTYIGQRLDGQQHFLGVIDEVAVWTEALSAAEIAELAAKVKVEDESVIEALLPAADGDTTADLNALTLRETATDLGDVQQTVTRTITVDADAPTVTFRSPVSDAYVNGNTINVSGEATDPTTSVGQVEVQVSGGAWQVAAGAESWSYPVDVSGLGEGAVSVSARATDAVGNTGTATSRQFIIDRTPPDVSLSANLYLPRRNSLGQWQIPFFGNVSDPQAGGIAGSGVYTVEVLLQGNGVQSGNGWQYPDSISTDVWIAHYTLPDFGSDGGSMEDPSGTYTLTMRTTDQAGNQMTPDAYQFATVELDAAGPVITLDSPLTTTEVISNAMTLSGQVSDANTLFAVEVNITPAEQIAALAGTILHLPFDEIGSTEYFVDQSGSNHPAVCNDDVSCPNVNQSGQRDLAVLFQTNDELIVSGIDLVDTSFTLAAWINRDATGNIDTIFSQGTNAQSVGLEFGFLASDQFRCGFGQDDLVTPDVFLDTQWHHWVCTYDASTRQRTLYRDGSQVAQDTAVANYQGSGDFFIGHGLDASNSDYEGRLDEVSIHNRAFAAYEVEDLYGYGQGVWEATTFNGDTTATWTYPIPEGANGLDGIYQINVRGIDLFGNSTPLGSQRLWRGEIDTRPPQMTFVRSFDASGSIPTTQFTCNVSDFNLTLDSICQPTDPTIDISGYRNSDITQFTYDESNPWYTSAITDTMRLYEVDAARTYSGTIERSITIETCDLYNHCATAGIQQIAAAQTSESRGAEILDPSPNTVLTSLDPVEITGDFHDEDGLHSLYVNINDQPSFATSWPDGGLTSADWRFTWTPPGEGIYRFQPFLTDQDTNASSQAESATQDGSNAGSAEQTIAEESRVSEDSERLYMPRIVSEGDQPYLVYLQVIQLDAPPQAVFTGTTTTLYVDLEPPTVDIDPVDLSGQQALSERVIELRGHASDSVLLHRVDVRVDDGLWRHAAILDDGSWRLPVWLENAPDGETYEVTARAEDIAGHVVTVTQSIYIDSVAPGHGEIGLVYVNSQGQRIPLEPGDEVHGATSLELSWDAATDGSGDIIYQAGFLPSHIADPTDLTTYQGPGTHSHAVDGAQNWYAYLRFVDARGNSQTVVLGPISVQE